MEITTQISLYIKKNVVHTTETYTTYPIKGKRIKKDKTREVLLTSLPAPSNYWCIQLVNSISHFHRTLKTRKERIRTDSFMASLAPFYAIFSGICTHHKLSRKLNLQTKYMLHLQSWWTRNDVYKICQSRGNLPNISSESKWSAAGFLGCHVLLLQSSLQEHNCLITCPICI